jgi:site-specific recombinase XerD
VTEHLTHGEILKMFREFMQARGMAENTIKSYESTGYEYLEVNKDSPLPNEAKHIRRYLAQKRKDGLSGNSLRQRYYTLKTFFESQDWTFPLTKRDLPQRSSKHRPVVTVKQANRILEVAKRMDTRYYIMFLVDACLGLRRGEIVNLNIADYKRPYIDLTTLKKGRKVTRKLPANVCDALDSYLETHRENASPVNPLFVNYMGERLTPDGASWIFRKVAKKAGAYQWRAGYHSIRRGILTYLYKSGIRESELTAEWGWTDESTIKNYTILSKAKVEQKIEDAHPMYQKEAPGTPSQRDQVPTRGESETSEKLSGKELPSTSEGKDACEDLISADEIRETLKTLTMQEGAEYLRSLGLPAIQLREILMG